MAVDGFVGSAKARIVVALADMVLFLPDFWAGVEMGRGCRPEEAPFDRPRACTRR